MDVLVALAALALAAWVAVLALPVRPWDLQPVAEEGPAPPEPAVWPAVTVLVPARNEATLLPATLPSLLGQDYPGPWQVVLVDDGSRDGTRAVFEAMGDGRLTVLTGAPTPGGWTGKVWALEQAAGAAGEPDYYLLTDADIRHSPGSLRRLVAESETGGLALNSRMARLHCRSPAERLLIPAFLYFFFLLYPPRVVNDPRRRPAAAAGGCILVRRRVVERAGGFAAIRGRLIDDVGLARAVKQQGGAIRLSLSDREVVSLRSHDLAAAWRMVRRTAFEQLRGSWLLVAATLAGLALLFLAPPAAVAAGLAEAAGGGSLLRQAALAGTGSLAWLASATSFLPAVRYFRLGRRWSLALPLAALLYAGMTVDSALRGSLGRQARW